MVGEVLVNAAPEACASPRDARRLATALNISKGWFKKLPMQGNLLRSLFTKAYGQSRQVNMAWKLWEDITRKQGLVPSGQLYGQMVDMLVTNNQHDKALALFEVMKQDH